LELVVLKSRGDRPALLASTSSSLAFFCAGFMLDSVMMRHALCMSLSTAAAVFLMGALHLSRGYWTTLTCLVILQPHGIVTLAKALQRVAGTIVGAGIAIVAATWIHDPCFLVVSVFLLTTVSVALLPLNYGIFAVFLMPSFVLLVKA